MRTLTLSQPATPLLCLQPLTADATAEAGAWVIVLNKKRRFALPGDLVARAATLSVDSLRSGGLVLLGLHETDVELFSSCGFTADWAKSYRALLDLLIEQHRARTEAAHEERAARWMSGERPRIDEARESLREIAQLAQAGSVRGGLDFAAADLQSLAGVRDALWEATAKLRVPAFRDALVKRGLDEARIRRLPKLCDELLGEQAAELVAQGRQAGAGDELLAWKAMALGDLTMLSSTARARLPQERWEPYQIGRLLGLSRASDRREERPAPTDRPTPSPAEPPAPIVAGPAPVIAGPAPVPGAAPPQLLPGTVLHTAAGADGLPWVLIVGPDGTPRWAPTAAPSAPTPAPRAPAPPIAAPTSAASPAPAPRARARRSGRR